MSKYESLVPELVRAFVETIVEQARDNMEKHGGLSPIAFCSKYDCEQINVVKDLATVDKDKGAAMIRYVAKKTDADFVLYVDECWLFTAQAETMKDARAIRDQYGGQVKDIPGRVDAVMFMLDTREGLFSANEIRQDASKFGLKYTFGNVDFEMMDASEGRFTSFLSPQGPKQ